MQTACLPPNAWQIVFAEKEGDRRPVCHLRYGVCDYFLCLHHRHVSLSLIYEVLV